MEKRGRRLVLAMLVVVLGGLAWLWLRPGPVEPAYQGRPLRLWVRELGAGDRDAGSIAWQPVPPPHGPKETAAQSAVQQIGANALPFLLQEMHAKESGFAWLRRHLPNWLSRIFGGGSQAGRSGLQPIARGPDGTTTADHRRREAGRALYMLGPAARPALPELVRLLHDPVTAADAAYALSGIGPEGIPPLLEALTNNNSWIAITAVWGLGRSPYASNAPAVIPSLLTELHNSDLSLAMGSAWALGQIRSNPELVAPALAANLTNTTPGVKNMTIAALKNYGLTNLTTPRLLEYLNDPRPPVRLAATNALKALDPDAASGAGMK